MSIGEQFFAQWRLYEERVAQPRAQARAKPSDGRTPKFETLLGDLQPIKPPSDRELAATLRIWSALTEPLVANGAMDQARIDAVHGRLQQAKADKAYYISYLMELDRFAGESDPWLLFLTAFGMRPEGGKPAQVTPGATALEQVLELGQGWMYAFPRFGLSLENGRVFRVSPVCNFPSTPGSRMIQVFAMGLLCGAVHRICGPGRIKELVLPECDFRVPADAMIGRPLIRQHSRSCQVVLHEFE